MEIVYLLQNNCDFEKAQTTNIQGKHFFLDLLPEGVSKGRVHPIDLAEDAFYTEEPRILKCHSPRKLLEKPVKKLAIYCGYFIFFS